MNERLKVKFNGGDLAIICSGCSSTIKTGVDFTKDEIEYTFSKGSYLPPQYCKQCTNKNNDQTGVHKEQND